jgi:hypothetical protein
MPALLECLELKTINIPCIIRQRQLSAEAPLSSSIVRSVSPLTTIAAHQSKLQTLRCLITPFAAFVMSPPPPVSYTCGVHRSGEACVQAAGCLFAASPHSPPTLPPHTYPAPSPPPMCPTPVQSTGLVKHVFRLLAKARDEQRPVPWVLLENVSAGLVFEEEKGRGGGGGV